MLKAALAAVLVIASAHAAEPPAGMVKTTKGKATIEREGKQSPASAGASLMPSDRVITGADGSVGITLRDETLLAVGPNSNVWLEKYAFDPTSHEGTLDATVKRGTLGVISGKLPKQSPGAVQFRTPTSILGVRGTEFVIDVKGGE
ncbi:MAG: FecR domain-containing protein [Pseudomonadota bacterium]